MKIEKSVRSQNLEDNSLILHLRKEISFKIEENEKYKINSETRNYIEGEIKNLEKLLKETIEKNY